MALYNKFSQMPFIPYRILEYLAYKNENIWKILKYDDYRCLEKPQLTFQEKNGIDLDGGKTRRLSCIYELFSRRFNFRFDYYFKNI